MNGARGLLAALLFLMVSGSLSAQTLTGRGGLFSGTLTLNRGRGLSLSLGAGCGYGYCGSCYLGGFGPVGFNTSVTIVGAPPPPPIIVLPPLVERGPGGLFDRLDDLERQQDRLPPVIERPPPGEQVGGFRAIRPGNREKARQPVPPEPKLDPKPPEPKPQPKPPPRPEAKPGELPPPPVPDPDPKVEYGNQLRLGQEAFALGLYGRAAQRFRLAITFAPQEPFGHFLLAQSYLAMAKYDEAFEAIREGLRRQPDWPILGFRPLRLYEGNVADYPEQLRRLEDLLDKNPDDPVLLFLFAYQLWFDGRQDEALPLFERAALRLPDRAMAELFLKHRPAGIPLV